MDKKNLQIVFLQILCKNKETKKDKSEWKKFIIDIFHLVQ